MPAKKDQSREERIRMEVVVDANGPEEQAMGWYYYLEEKIKPFGATCTAKRSISPLKIGDHVEVLDLAPQDECEHEMFVTIRWEKAGLAVPLSQLKPAKDTDPETREAVEDWLYWVKQGYEL